MKKLALIVLFTLLSFCAFGARTYFEVEKGVVIDNALFIENSSGKFNFKDSEITSAKSLKDLITALTHTFDNSTNGFTASNVQTAIEEARNTAQGKVRFAIPFGYGGQGKGQWFEIFKGLASNSNPFVSPFTSTVKEFSCSFTSGSNPSGTVGLYKNASLAYSFTINNEIKYFTGLSISVSAGDKISVLGENSSSTLSGPLCIVFFTVN